MDIHQRLRRIREQETLRLQYKTNLAKWRKEPLIWLEERYGESSKSFLWSEYGEEYENHKWDGDKDPIAQAWSNVALQKNTVITSATGIGKTYWLPRLTYWFLDCFENSLVIAAGPTSTQLRDNYWAEMGLAFNKFRKHRPTSTLLNNILRIGGSRSSEDDFEKAGWGVISRYGSLEGGASKDKQSVAKAQGSHRKDMLIIIDEAAGVSRALLKTFENTSVGTNNVIVLVGNPDSKNDTLAYASKRPSYTTYRASAYDFPNVVCSRDIIHGATTVKSIDQRKLDYGEDSPFYNSRIRGIVPSQLENTLVKCEWIYACMDGDVLPDKSHNAMGIDVANSQQGDKACVVSGKANMLMRIDLFQCPNASLIAHNVLFDSDYLASKGFDNYLTAKIDDYEINQSAIGVDSVGVGVSTINTFLELGYSSVIGLQGGQNKDLIPTDNRGKMLYEFNSLRSQMLWMLREDIRQKQIDLSNLTTDQLEMFEEEITSIQYERKGGKITMEKKEDLKARIGRSPDLMDGIMYWNYMRRVTSISSGVWSVE